MTNGVGVKVVGAPAEETTAPTGAPTRPDREAGRPRRRRDGSGHGRLRPAAEPTPPRRPGRAVAVLAVLGLAGTLVFGLLWAGKSGSAAPSDPAMISAGRTFMTDLTNFNAKSIDADFNAINAMATGAFSGQATKFFNSSIRSELQDALAESRGQIRNLYVQSDNGSQAALYVVDDQVYVNNKITTPQSDVLRVVLNLQKVGGVWKISDVTVLEGATPGSAASPSGSAGSTVPGQ
jgi:hypothetical protein